MTPANILRREPFRLLFPLALAIGIAGVYPWFLFGRGYIATWPGIYHSLTMTQAFLAALAVGFLGTMLPRRAQTPPLSWLELAVAAGALVAIPVALALRSLVAAEAAFVTVVVTLVQFVVRSFVARRAGRPPPPSFVLVPFGLLMGVTGAVLIALGALARVPFEAFLVGRQLALQGFLLAMVLAVAPLLGPILATGAPPEDPPPARLRRQRAIFAAVGLGLAASILVEVLWSERGGLAARGALCAAVIAATWAPLRRPGLHRALFQIALWMVPAGLLGAATWPILRIPLLHLTFVSGFSLLAMSVSIHVTLLHTGREAMTLRNPWPVAAGGALMLAAAAVRAGAETMSLWYFEAITVAAALWLLAAVVWGLFLVLELARPAT